MQKKLLLVATAGLVVVSAHVFAAPAPAPAAAITGATVKAASHANVEAENTDTTQPSTTTQSPAPASVQSSPPLASSLSLKSAPYAGLGLTVLNDRGFTGLMPKVMVGYGTFYRKFYGALEMGGGAGTLLLSGNNQRYRVSNFVNVSVIPGYVISDNLMLYARLGAQETRYSKFDSTKNGGVYGIGVEFNYSQKWDTRVEYNYAVNTNLNQYIVDFIYKFR